MSFLMTHKSDDGDILEFLANDSVLLSYQDLLEAKEKEKYNLQFRIKAGKATFNESEIEENTIITIPTTTEQKQSIFALTFGGWLPLPFIGESLILADRNVIDGMKKIHNTDRQDMKWWIDKLLHVDATVNPILYAYEGKDRAFNSFEDFCKAFDEGASAIDKYGMKSIVYTTQDYEASYEILKNLKVEIDKEIEFLMVVVPLVVKTYSAKKREDVQAKIDIEIENKGLSNNSLAYLLVLSCLYEDNTKSDNLHARKVLKPKAKYTYAMAYNAVMDLLNLKMLILTRKVPSMKKTFFCTADFHLAAFWVGLNVHDITERDSAMTFLYDVENVLPKRDM